MAGPKKHSDPSVHGRTSIVRVTPAAIALNRFGLGARLGESPPTNPSAWLHAQLDVPLAQTLPPVWSQQPGTQELAMRMGEGQAELRRLAREQEDLAKSHAQVGTLTPRKQTVPHADAASDVGQPALAASRVRGAQPASADGKDNPLATLRQAYNLEIRDTYRAAVDARLTGALTTPTPFVERLVYFWSNHFALSIEKQPVTLLAGAFETDAIRPHVLGRFEDMLVAVEQHPAMQYFLDQNGSIGPDSEAAVRAEARNAARRVGLNENLARETMELHTLGVRTGYTQQDVTEFAKALTGWSVTGLPAAQSPTPLPPGVFVFRPQAHEPGERTIMGRTYADLPGPRGVQQGLTILHDFATSPATAQHIARKLAVHFVSDNPPPALVARLADAFQKSEGHLPTVYRALIDSPEAWQPVNAKFKTPWEWTVSATRGLGWQSAEANKTAPMLRQLGQPIWQPGSPAGYDDIAASWAAPDALVRRVEFAQRLAARVGDRVDARTVGPQWLAGSLSPETATEIGRAESASAALALLMVSPDFLRR
ncbi:DUF1800 domain-containing protein [Robbsia sp. KACC 23696]|uniref:DUF1800 domain-containing protein n=1 Tax=Robbsia sp. KACC 23696 TaxID=3149231 RepID=UPI00325B53CD